MKLRGAYIVVTMVVAILVAACASIGTPDGGPYDETPPKVVHTTPEFGATNTRSQKIVLEFDENIRIDNAAEKVVVSPPQMEMPDIYASGKRITITLADTIRPGVTYTIDFADAIEDNNEQNPMGDYAFTFSTGDSIDTMQVSGYVLDASNLEPIKGILVGMYAAEPDATADSPDTTQTDTTFRTVPFERISRTDSRGHFVVKGLARRPYRIFALNDQDQTYTFSQKGEMLAFTDRLIIPTSKPDIRPDTVWHDSIYYDSIVYRPYTHFFPDDITLLAFKEKVTDRYLLKTERPNLWLFSVYFTSASDQLPVIEGLNFDATDAFVVEANPTNDTITYWIRDSLIYNLDTLNMIMQFMGTDTLGQLTLQTDTLELISKVSKERLEKSRQKEYEEWVKQYRDDQKKARRRSKAESRKQKDADNNKDADESEVQAEEPEDQPTDPDYVPPMPEVFLDMKLSPTTLDPLQNVDISFAEPIDTAYLDSIRFFQRVDSLREPRDFIIRRMPQTMNAFRLYAEWEPGGSYEVEIDTGIFVNIYGTRNEKTVRQLKVRSLESYGYLGVVLHNAGNNAVVQLLDGGDKVVKTVNPENGHADFFYVLPGTYYLRMFCDDNGNNQWDTGDYESRTQAETVYYYPQPVTVRAQWDVTQDWYLNATPIYQQKPEKITKQKPDKQKTVKSRNAERAKNKNKK